MTPISTASAAPFDFSASKKIRAVEEKAVSDIARATAKVDRQIDKFGSDSRQADKAVENRDRTQVKATVQLSRVGSTLLSSPIAVNQASTAVDSYPPSPFSPEQPRPPVTEPVAVPTAQPSLGSDLTLTSPSEVGIQTVAATPVPFLTAGNVGTSRPTPSTPFPTPAATTPASATALLKSEDINRGVSSTGSTPLGPRVLEQSPPSTVESVADPAPKPSNLSGPDRARPSESGTRLSAEAPLLVRTLDSQRAGTGGTFQSNSPRASLRIQGTAPQKIEGDGYPSLRNRSLEEGTVRSSERQLDNASPRRFGYAYGRAQREAALPRFFSSPTPQTNLLSTAENYASTALGTNRTTSTPTHLTSGGIALSVLSSLTASNASLALERATRTRPGIAEYGRSQDLVGRARPSLFPIRL